MWLRLVLIGALIATALPSTTSAAPETVTGLSVIADYKVGTTMAPELSMHPPLRWPETGPIEGIQVSTYPGVVGVPYVMIEAGIGGTLDVGVYQTDAAPGGPKIVLGDNCFNDGMFAVRELEVTANAVTRLAFDWDFTCAGGGVHWAGQYRLDSTIPLDGPDLLPFDSSNRVLFGEVVGGTTSPAQVVTFRNRGTTTLTLGQLSLADGTPEQFLIDEDGCSDAVVAPGGSCEVAVRATPAVTGGWTHSRLVFPFASPALTTIDAELLVTGLVPTETTITVPDTVMASTPIDLQADVTPHVPAVTDYGWLAWWVNDVPVDRQVKLPPGQHVIRAAFSGEAWQGGPRAAPSEGTKTITALIAASMQLEATTSEVVPEGTPVGFSATLWVAETPDAGNLVIRNATTNAVLGTTPVTAAGVTVLTVAPVVLPPGSNVIMASFEGDPDIWPASASITQVETPDDTVAIYGANVSASAFYPAKDDYADRVTFTGQPGEELTVRIDALSSSGSAVRTWKLGKRDHEFRVSWNGRRGDGTKVPADTYTIRMTFVDWKGNSAIVERSLRLSWRQVKWVTTSITKHGKAAYDTARAGTGKVSRSGSAYGKGIKLRGGSNANSYAAALWIFSVKPGLAYRDLSIGVLGHGTRSRSQAVLAFPEARYGVLVGPRYRWWTRKGDANRHIDGGAVGAVVSANGPMPGAFDVEKVRVTYTYAVWR